MDIGINPSSAWKVKGKHQTFPTKEWAYQLHQEYVQEKPSYESWMKKNIVPSDAGELQCRVKDPVSIEDSINIALKGGYSTPANIQSIDDAKDYVADILGSRIVLKTGAPSECHKVVHALANAIKKGYLEIETLFNIKGENTQPYFDQTDLKELEEASQTVGKTIDIREGEEEISPFGYTAVLMDIIEKNDRLSELQVIGPEVLKVAEPEHSCYDVMSWQKRVTKGSAKIAKLLQPLIKALKNLSPAQKDIYMTYWNHCFEAARDKELGKSPSPVTFPQGLPSSLSLENLKVLNEKYHSLKKSLFSES